MISAARATISSAARIDLAVGGDAIDQVTQALARGERDLRRIEADADLGRFDQLIAQRLKARMLGAQVRQHAPAQRALGDRVQHLGHGQLARDQPADQRCLLIVRLAELVLGAMQRLAEHRRDHALAPARQ